MVMAYHCIDASLTNFYCYIPTLFSTSPITNSFKKHEPMFSYSNYWSLIVYF